MCRLSVGPIVAAWTSAAVAVVVGGGRGVWESGQRHEALALAYRLVEPDASRRRRSATACRAARISGS